MAEFNLGRAIAGAAAGFGSGATGQDFLTPYIATLTEKRKSSRRLGAQRDILGGQLAGNPELKEFWDNQLTSLNEEGADPVGIDAKLEIVAGYDPREFDAMHSEAIRFLADKGKTAEKEEDRARATGSARREYETTFRALGQQPTGPREGQTEEEYVDELRGLHNAQQIGYQRAGASLDEFQEEQRTLVADIEATDPSEWMQGDTAMMFNNRAGTLVESAQRELGGFFDSQAARFADPIMQAMERKSEEARLSTLQERIALGNYTDDKMHPTFAEGARKSGRQETYSESDYLKAGMGERLKLAGPIYDDIRQMVQQGVAATPEIADARQYIITNELSEQAFNNLPFEQRRELAELLLKVPPEAAVGARQLHANATSRRTSEERFASALVTAGVSDPQRIAGIVADQRLYQIDRGSPDSPLRVEIYQGLAPEGVARLAELMPDSVGTASSATAWANRVARDGGLTQEQRTNLVERAVGTATNRRDRGALVSMERSLERPPDVDRQRAIIGEIVSVASAEAETIEFEPAYRLLNSQMQPRGWNLAIGAPRHTFDGPPRSESGRREWVEMVRANADTLRARLESIPQSKGTRSGRAQALAALDAIEQSPESMIVRGSGAPDLRGPTERLIESVVSGLDQDAINVRTKEIAGALAEVQASRTGGFVDEALLIEEESALLLEQQQIEQMQQAGLSGEVRRGVLRSLVEFAGDSDTDWEERVQDIGARFGGFDPDQTLPAWAGDAVTKLKAAEGPSERILILRDLAAKNPDLFYKASAVPGSGQAGLLVSRAFRGDLDEIVAAASDLAETGTVGSKAEMEKRWAVSLPNDYDARSSQDKALMLLAAGLSARPLTGRPKPAPTGEGVAKK